MSIVIEDKEFDPMLRESIAAFVDANYVEEDFAEPEAREYRYDTVGSYEPGFGGYDPFTGEPSKHMQPMPGDGAPDGGYYEEPMVYRSSAPAAAAPMPEPKATPRRKLSLRDSASGLVERVRESVSGPKHEDEAPGDTVKFKPIRLEAVELEEAVESEEAIGSAPPVEPVDYQSYFAAKSNLQDWLDQVDEPFSTTLLMLIDRKGLTDVDVYKRANMSRQLFSRIRSDALYRPAKKTVLALGIAMKLSLDELRDLLQRAGYALSRSSKRDIIVEYFVTRGDYNLNRINEALYDFDQPLI